MYPIKTLQEETQRMKEWSLKKDMKEKSRERKRERTMKLKKKNKQKTWKDKEEVVPASFLLR